MSGLDCAMKLASSVAYLLGTGLVDGAQVEVILIGLAEELSAVYVEASLELGVGERRRRGSLRLLGRARRRPRRAPTLHSPTRRQAVHQLEQTGLPLFFQAGARLSVALRRLTHRFHYLLWKRQEPGPARPGVAEDRPNVQRFAAGAATVRLPAAAPVVDHGPSQTVS